MRHLVHAIIIVAVSCVEPVSAADTKNDSVTARPANRIVWTSGRITGSPDRALPFKAERVFEHLTFSSPVLAVPAPRSNRLFVGERFGKAYSFELDSQSKGVGEPDVFFDLKASFQQLKHKGDATRPGSLYGLAFHPQFPDVPVCFLCFTFAGKTGQDHPLHGTHVSRFTVLDPTGVPRVDVGSEELLLTWMQGGHNGGCLKFGPDGFLYVSAGDASVPSPPDVHQAGQDVTNFLSTIMRIDVTSNVPSSSEMRYVIPADNPFVGRKNVRPEIWSYGHRNPWRMSFDRGTGDLWVGDVGWELFEMVYRVQKGANYGWSIMEGPQRVLPNAKRGPTKILPPTISYPHSLGASVTGGYVYRGTRLPALQGAYIYGDFETRRIWAAKMDGDQLVSNIEVCEPTIRIVSFGEDNSGEIYLLDFDAGTLNRLVPNDAEDHSDDFPTRLSETGLFQSVADHELAAGVVKFDVNSALWADGTVGDRFVAIPSGESGTASAEFFAKPKRLKGSSTRWNSAFPKDSVLGRTVSLPVASSSNTQQSPRIETQLLHFDGRRWNGYSYAWNKQQTDAELVDAGGREIDMPDASGNTYRLSGRAECRRCHNQWVGSTLGFTLNQLNRPDSDGNNQLQTLAAMGLITGHIPKSGKSHAASSAALVDPHNTSEDLDRRVRSYLHTNCAHCHQNGAGGTATIDLRHSIAVSAMKLVGHKASQGAFGIDDAALVTAGDPYRSVLYYRMSKSGRGRMPHVGSELVDPRGTQLIHDWIMQLPLRRGQSDVAKPFVDSNSDDRNSNKLIASLLSNPVDALRLSTAIGNGKLSKPIRDRAVRTAMEKSESEIRDLFERFVSPDERTKRLGVDIKPEQIMALVGRADVGRRLFIEDKSIQCRQCHSIDATRENGRQVARKPGPSLDSIGSKYRAAELLTHLLEPSKTIDPKYTLWTVETKKGRVHSGLLDVQDDAQVILIDAQGKPIRIGRSEIEELQPQAKSIMPELLLRDMTAQQVADLLSFLVTLKAPIKP